MEINGYYNRAEAMRYFRAKKGDAQAQTLLDEAYFKLRNEFAPKFMTLRVACEIVCAELQKKMFKGCGKLCADEVRLYGPASAEAEREIIREGEPLAVIRSRSLAHHLNGCGQALLFAATLGARVDVALRRTTLERVSEGAAAQAVAASVIEEFCDEICRGLQKRLQSNYLLRPRFSPGYGDWNLEEGQRMLFRLLDCSKTIGLTLTSTGMMAPTKSVTALIGLSPRTTGQRGAYEEQGKKYGKCADCGKRDCEFRR